jgi:hypothetical protein
MTIGDKVEWASQSQGYSKQKCGYIVAVVIPGESPNMAINLQLRGYSQNLRNPGLPRDHESYVVQVGTKLYWPRVSQLRMAARGL